jgi:hypothetical protein
MLYFPETYLNQLSGDVQCVAINAQDIVFSYACAGSFEISCEQPLSRFTRRCSWTLSESSILAYLR